MYRCDCLPKVSTPSIKGPLYWKAPNFIPSIYKAKAVGNTKIPGTNIFSSSTINNCMNKYTYFWLNNGTEFWSVPILLKNNYAYLWIWNNVSWIYLKLSIDDINCFMWYWT
ncbi:hypothetical protein LGK95_03955 [Clostridium algoriphilum]|uniref:hypothetical protein n=1 Tax=Clostridium algoriphilum TaxID=198347 RepID=UPI001CF42B78|nr:hypothetical protein [Clostridium algoriphilum]MCB2292691.1 hypothetical protein [Clostridium algoriphilum]